MSAAARLRQAWQQRGPLALLLWPLTLPYRLLTALRRALYRTGLLKQHRLPVPVIVVGNVIVGGAGKTPVTLALLQHLRAAGWRPGVISRGYGRQTISCRPALPTSSAAARRPTDRFGAWTAAHLRGDRALSYNGRLRSDFVVPRRKDCLPPKRLPSEKHRPWKRTRQTPLSRENS